MENYNHYNKDGSKPSRVDQFYMVDTGRTFNMDLYEGVNNGLQKKEREMIIKIIIWMWYGPGLSSMLLAFLAFVFKWIHIGDVKSFITISIAVITGLSKAIIMWAEKGDVVTAKVKRILTFRRRQRYLKKNKQDQNRFK